MILSYDQIRAVTQCRDCARREVTIVTLPSAAELFVRWGADPDDAEAAAAELGIEGAVNLIWVHHDGSCHRPNQFMTTPFGHDMLLAPVDVPENSSWVRQLRKEGLLS